MKTLIFLAASALALSAAACAPNPKPDLRTALDCPVSQGDLTRTGKTADGKICTYRSRDGAEVSLQLVAVTGDPVATLQAIENRIAPDVAPAAAGATQTAADAAQTAKDGADTAKDAAATASDAAGTARDAASAARQAAEDAGRSATVAASEKDEWSGGHADGDKVDIQIGKHGKVVADDDTAEVNLPGIHISAKDDDADVRIGGIRINANEDEQTIHVMRDVRLRGEALSRTKRGIRATFIAASKASPTGYRFVGYEAAGPRTGPLTVAVVKSKAEYSHDDDIARDIKRLVRRNGGA